MIIKTIFVKALTQRYVRGGLRPKDMYWQFNTDGIFLSSNQNEIFLKIVQIDLSSVLKGADLVIIALGQIDSGKTYTISAPYESHSDRGIIPRLLATIFNMKKNVGTYQADIKCKMSFVEFFHDECYNLLTSGPVKIKHNALIPETIVSIEDALGKFFRGETRRKFERVSNHCGASVLTLYVEAKSMRSSSANINFAKIHIVDCPGTELFSSSKGKCQACKIGASLNKFNFDRATKWSCSLDEVLKSRNRLPCPPVFNCSNLISFLGRSLTNGMVRFIGHVKTGREHIKLTLSTLRFGCKMAKYLFSQVIYNSRPELANVAGVLQDEVARLENEAHQNSLIRTGGEYKWNNVFQGEIQHIERLIGLYLGKDGRITENILLSTAHPLLVFREIKNHYKKELKKQLELLESGTGDASEVPEDIRSKKSDAGRGSDFKLRRTSILASQPQASSVSQEPVAPVPEGSAPVSNGISSGAGAGKRKSVARKSLKRQSIAKKSKVGPVGRGGDKAAKQKSGRMVELPEIPPEFNKEMLEFGLKNNKWFFEEFLKRNAEIDQQFKAFNDQMKNARNGKDKACWSLVEERQNLAEATYGAEEAACKQSAGGGELDLAREQELLAHAETIKLKINEAMDEMKSTHETYLNAIAAQEKFMKETGEPKFKEFVKDLETRMAEVPINRADEKDRPLFRADTFKSLRPEHKTDARTISEIEFAGFQKKYGVKKTGKVVKMT